MGSSASANRAGRGPSVHGWERIILKTLFQQDWWLEAVSPGRWRAIEVKRAERVVASLAFVERRRHALTFLGQPPLTQHLGPTLSLSTAKYASRLAEQKDLIGELIDQLPRFDEFAQSFSPSITNWLPWYWRGFEETTRYTYVLDDLSDLARVQSEFTQSTRYEIRKAEKTLSVRDDLGLARFIDLNAMTFARQQVEAPYSVEVIERLDDACARRGCRRMFFAEDAQGRVHAAIYLVWDDQTAYYLMGGADPGLRSSSATSLLMWSAIRHAAALGRRFDFEGSMIEPVEDFVRGFGARQVPYFRVTRRSRRLRAVHHLRHAIAAVRGR